MYIDAKDIENNSIIEGDICIIGAGAAGITIALEWNNSPYKIILLEGGGFEYDEKIQELYDGKITGQNYYPMMSSRLHYFGGTTRHWGGICSTLDDIDFKQNHWINESGWPITRRDLDPYYKRSQPILDLGPYEYDIKYWQQIDKSFTPLKLDESAVYSKIFQRSTPTRFGKKFKSSIVNSPNIHLYTYANATDITLDTDLTNVSEVEIKNYAGKTHRVKAKNFVMACGAIQNARFLLNSNKQIPGGLGNNYDLVGRYFMEHIEIKSGELWLKDANPLELYKWNRPVYAELGISSKKQEELKILNGTISLNPLEMEKKLLPNMVTWSNKDPRESLDMFVKNASEAFGRNRLQRLFSSESHHAFGMYSRMQQAPNYSSRVTLNNEKDSLGMHRVSLNWQLSPIDKKSLRELNKLIGQQVGLAGIGRVKLYDFLIDENDDSMPDYTSGGWHHMGTTKMHTDPKKGVVDENCKVHGISNLFIAGSSCFATSGAVPPTLSIVALSLRLSDYLKYQSKI